MIDRITEVEDETKKGKTHVEEKTAETKCISEK